MSEEMREKPVVTVNMLICVSYKTLLHTKNFVLISIQAPPAAMYSQILTMALSWSNTATTSFFMLTLKSCSDLQASTLVCLERPLVLTTSFFMHLLKFYYDCRLAL